MLGRTDRPDIILFAAVLLLVGIGIVMVASASSVTGYTEHGDPYYYLKRQSVWAALGVLAVAVLMRIDYRVYRALAGPALFLTVLLLALVLVVGPEIGGARRWIALRVVNIQPSELAKLAVVNYLAAYLALKRDDVRRFWTGFVPPLLVVGVVFGLILLEPDFGTAVAVFGTAVIMLFAAGAQIGHLAGVGLAGLPLLGLLIWLEPYRVRRLVAFVDPWADKMDSGWNIIQSLLAIGSGGLLGLGLGAGRQKYLYVPAQHTDFIFAIMGEELGFIGTTAVIGLFFVVAWRGYRIALHAPDLFGCLLAVGITSVIIFQALLNIGVVTGSLPVTGITLPFVSFGGSSLTVTMAGVGVLLNISRNAMRT